VETKFHELKPTIGGDMVSFMLQPLYPMDRRFSSLCISESIVLYLLSVSVLPEVDQYLSDL